MSNNPNGSHSHNHFLKPKQVIGSCKLPCNFKLTQAAFHHDDIPLVKRERKNEVKQWMKSKVLSIEQAGWCKSTEVDKSRNPICERRTMENFVHDRSKFYQYNYRAEVLPDKLIPPIDKSQKFHITEQSPSMIAKLQEMRANDETGILRGKFKVTEEMPINPKLKDAVEWNNRTQYVRDEVEACGREFTKTALESTKLKHTRLFQTNLLGTSTVRPASEGTRELDGLDIEGEGTRTSPILATTSSLKYVSPMESSQNILEEVRRQKKEGTFSTKKTVFQKVEEPVDRSKLRNRLAIEPSRKYKVTEHSGRWEFNPVEGRHMWSDTGSFIYESRGDVVFIKNPDGYNYASPNMYQPSWKLKSLANNANGTQPLTTNLTKTASNNLSNTMNSIAESPLGSPSMS